MNLLDKLNDNVVQINEQYRNSNLFKIQELTAYDYLFSFSKNRQNSVLISVNLQNPFIKITNKKFLQNRNSAFFQHLKTRLLNAYFIGCEIINNDNIIAFNFVKTNDTYDKIEYKLIFEMFKNNCNIILTSKNLVVEAYRYKGLDTNHPILNNVNYEHPVNTIISKDFTQEDEKRIETYFTEIETKYLSEKYSSLISSIKRKRKTLIKKVDKLKEEQVCAKEHECFKDYGDALKMNFDVVKKGDSSFVYNDIKIPLKKEYSPSKNLEYFYKMYKKSKLTIESTKKYIIETGNEIQYLDNILATISLYNEDEYQQLINDLLDNKLVKIKYKKNNKKSTNAHKPYYILFNGTRIGYGKNNVQNDELTFNIATKHDSFLHISKAHGPHIVIFNDDPSDEIIQFACELSLFLAKVTDGDVIYSKIMYLKKTPNLGQVRMSKYETYHINKIRSDMSEYVANSLRF